MNFIIALCYIDPKKQLSIPNKLIVHYPTYIRTTNKSLQVN